MKRKQGCTVNLIFIEKACTTTVTLKVKHITDYNIIVRNNILMHLHFDSEKIRTRLSEKNPRYN
jgi:hypothetical protein